MDDFPIIVPEDDGFAIYLNDERIDWYDNEADAEGVALYMVDEPLNDESFFDEEPLEESIQLKERSNYDGPKVYTGLAAEGGMYSEIISSVVGQIWDGIGEGDGREGRIFNYYYKNLDYIGSHSEDGEFVVEVDPYDVEQLVRCIWRIAQIERNDNGWTDKNHEYCYLRDAPWKDICKLNAALKAAIENGNQPWSEEKKNAALGRITKAKADAAAEKKAKEETEAKKETDFNTKINTIIPDAKDIKRAKDAWDRGNGNLYKMYQALLTQLNRIEDIDKAKRRIVAFYKEALKHTDAQNFTDRIKHFKNLIDRDIDL